MNVDRCTVPAEETLQEVYHVHILYTTTALNAHALRLIKPVMLTVDAKAVTVTVITLMVRDQLSKHRTVVSKEKEIGMSPRLIH